MAVTRSSAKKYTPTAGDIIWANLSPTHGHEQRGVRPLVVISEKAYNYVSGLCTVIPITSVQKGFINEVVIHTKVTQGVALVDQVRTLDYTSRSCVRKDAIATDTLVDIRAKLAPILGL